MNIDYLKTVHGLISIFQVALGFVALFIGAVIWPGGSVYILIFPDFAPGILYVLFALLVTWSVTLGVTAMQLMDRGILETLGKLKVLLYHGIMLGLLIIAAGWESYYAGKDFVTNYNYKTRTILDTIILWVLVVTHVAQLIFVALQK